MEDTRQLKIISNGRAGRIGSHPLQRKTTHTLNKELEFSSKCDNSTLDNDKWLPQWKLHQVLCEALSPITIDLSSGTPPENLLEILVRREIKGKLSSHKSYDQTHGMDIECLATDTNILYKLLTQKERCYYCHCLLHVLYQDRFDPFQWSLDRIDNSKGHTNANTIVSCLRCNLRRRTRESKDFYRDRNLRIEKEDIEHV